VTNSIALFYQNLGSGFILRPYFPVPLRLFLVPCLCLLALASPLAAACTEEIKAKMIANDVSQETIDKTCGSPAQGSSNPALGIRLATSSKELATKYNLPPGQKGVVVTDVTPGGLAAKSGLKKGDLILFINQMQIVTAAQFNAVLRAAGESKTQVTLQRAAVGVKVLELQKGKTATAAAPRSKASYSGTQREHSQIPSFTLSMGIVAGIYGYVLQQAAIDDANFASSLNDKQAYNDAKGQYENAVTLQKQAVALILLGMFLDSQMNGPAPGSAGNLQWTPHLEPMGQKPALGIEYKW